MCRGMSAIRFSVVVAATMLAAGFSWAQQPPKPATETKQSKDASADWAPKGLKLSANAKEWFNPAARAFLSHGKREITVLEDDDMLEGDLDALPLLPEVNSLCLMGGFSEQGLARLRGLKTIEYLHLEDNIIVNDKELEYFATMPNLRKLEILIGYGITDKGLEILSKAPRLEVLELVNADITEKGLRYLKKFPELRELRLAGTKLTWACLERFPKVDKLRICKTIS